MWTEMMVFLVIWSWQQEGAQHPDEINEEFVASFGHCITSAGEDAFQQHSNPSNSA